MPAMPETARRIHTRRWGVQRSTMSMVPAPPGRTCQPLAKPLTSVGEPRSLPDAVASQPPSWLCPSTSQNGVPSVRTRRWYESGVLLVTRTAAPEARTGAPAVGIGVGAPAVSDDNTTPPTVQPVV